MSNARFAIAASILIALALLVLRPQGEPGATMRDFEAYYSAGATWLAHGDPYSNAIYDAETRVPGVVATRNEVLPFVGLPATLPFWAIFATVPYAQAVVSWSAVLVASFALLVIAAGRVCRLTFTQTGIAALVALAFVPITSDFVLGQAALPAFAAALASLILPLRVAPVAVALSSLQPNVALGLLGTFGARASTIAVLGGAAIVYLCGTLCYGFAWPVAYVHMLAAHATAERFATIQYTPAAVFYGFGIAPTLASVGGWLVALAAIAYAGYSVARTQSIAHRFAIVCCAIPFVTGFFHEHDFVVMWFPAIVALFFAPSRAPLTVAATVLVGVNWLDFAQQPQAAAQDIVLAFGLFAACITIAPSRVVTPLVAVAIALALGAWIGATHHVPIWPNHMGPVAPGATPADTWKNEQLQTGLLRPDAAAALLRSFALLGAALLFYVTSNIDVHHVIERCDRVGMEPL